MKSWLPHWGRGATDQKSAGWTMGRLGAVAGVIALAIGALAWIGMQLLPSAVLADSFSQPPPAASVVVSHPAAQAEQNPPADPAKPRKKTPRVGAGQKMRGLGPLQKPGKVAICHRTDSAERPHITLNVSERAWPAHARHGDQAGTCP